MSFGGARVMEGNMGMPRLKLEQLWGGDPIRVATLAIAGLCTVAAMLITAFLILAHLANWRRSRQQVSIILIVMMVPVFAVSSFVGLINATAGELFFTKLDSIKECYEAVVIAAFLELMFSYLGLHARKSAVLPKEMQGKTIHHSFPVTLFVKHEAPLDKSTLWLLRWFTWQFVLLRPPLSLLVMSLQKQEAYDGALGWLVSIMLQVSVFFAMYSMIQFYHGFEKQLHPHRPLAKLLSIKGIVFFAFWQGIIINLLAKVKVIHGDRHFFYTVRQVEDALQNFFVCVEMVAFALVNLYAFNYKPYTEAVQEKKEEAKKEEAKKEK